VVEPVSLSLNPCRWRREAASLSSKKYHCCRIRVVCLIFVADCRTRLLANPFRHRGTRLLVIESGSSSSNPSPRHRIRLLIVESVSRRIRLAIMEPPSFQRRLAIDEPFVESSDHSHWQVGLSRRGVGRGRVERWG